MEAGRGGGFADARGIFPHLPNGAMSHKVLSCSFPVGEFGGEVGGKKAKFAQSLRSSQKWGKGGGRTKSLQKWEVFRPNLGQLPPSHLRSR